MRSSAMAMDAALWGLFVSAFVSATILPGTSELALVALVVHDPSRAGAAIAVASIGNTLGGMTSYAIGRLLPRVQTRSRALALARDYGPPVLLLSWVPVIGDALCIASGWLRHGVVPATLYMAAGKLVRYGIIAHAALTLSG